MKDPRIERKKLHPLENIIFISIAAVVCGADTWEDLEDFGHAKFDWLSGILDMKNGVPSHDTFNRFFRALDPGEFEKHFMAWAQSLVSKDDYEFVSIDGKTIRQASKMSDVGGIHIVSAWANRNEVTLGQLKTSEKSNEITAIPTLLESLLLENCTVSINAMGCQKEIAKKIRDKKADYILAVKANHPRLYDEIESSFSLLKSESFLPPVEIGHGRIETRKYFFT
jgi:predicted transposase YbfD/YdcC